MRELNKNRRVFSRQRDRPSTMKGYSGMLPFPITELDVQALIDSQLTWEEEKQVWREIENNEDLMDYYKRMLIQKKLLVVWWQSMQEEAESEEKPPLVQVQN
jgi:hypothetical protein